MTTPQIIPQSPIFHPNVQNSVTTPIIPPRIITPISDSVKESYKIKSYSTQVRFAKVLIASAPKVGKTSIIGTASRKLIGEKRLNNLLYVEFDPNGADTFIDMGIDCDVVHPENFNDIIGLLTALHTSNFDQYDTIGWDTYSIMQDIIYSDINNISIKDTTKPKNEILEGFRDFNLLYRRCERINKLLLSLNKHIICTAHSATKDNPSDSGKKKEDRRQILSLALDGKMAHLLSASFSVHMILENYGTGNNRDVIAKFFENNTEAGSRFQLPISIPNITFPILLDLMKIPSLQYKRIKWEHYTTGFKPIVVPV
jgi:hypothetical protein